VLDGVAEAIAEVTFGHPTIIGMDEHQEGLAVKCFSLALEMMDKHGIHVEELEVG
jgi:hypothetical protein